MSVRVRFAPSPTGFLHIGGVRVSLFNWLFARHHGGQFLLRIEDTDTERSEERFTRDILACHRWLGLKWDEDVVYQSTRLGRHRELAEQLVKQGHAYYCTCTEEEVEKMRVQAMAEGKKPMYDRRCRERGLGPSPGAIIRVKSPQEGTVGFHDLIRGTLDVDASGLDDFVLIRSNGAPTYNHSVVCDDAEMRITHVIRGDDHINNTPKQILIYQYLGYPVPEFAHLPMILGPDKKKLSKRHGDVSANIYRSDGHLPEALLNFLVRLGWSHGDQEIFSIDEMIRLFDFKSVQTSAAVFNVEKLLWLNGHHIRTTSQERLRQIVDEDFGDFFSEDARMRLRTALALELIRVIQPKVKLVKELADQLVPLCTPGVVAVDPRELKWEKSPEIKKPVQEAIRALLLYFEGAYNAATRQSPGGENRAAWGGAAALGELGLGHEAVNATVNAFCQERGLKLGDFAQPVRLWLSGRMVSAGLFELMTVLPWDVVRDRLDAAANA